jgi:Ca2+-binding EF-hand superfamily protein
MEGAKPEINYDFTFDQKKNLGPQEQTQLIKVFRNYDTNKDGVMDQGEFKNIMIDLGHRKITDTECKTMLDKFD